MAKPVMIIDLASDSVSGLLLDPTYDKAKKIFCSPTRAVTRVPLPFQPELNLERFLNQVVTAMKTVLDALAREPHAHPARVACFLSAPFYASQTRLVRHVAETPFHVTETLLNDLVAGDLKEFTAQHPQLYAEVLEDKHQVIESKTMQVKLNRYLTHTPYGKTASEVELHHYVSIGSKKILDRFHEVIRGSVHRAPIEFHSFPFALYSICRDHFRDREHRFIIDIGAEITEVLLLSDDILWESVSFPAGHNGFVRELTASLNTVPEEALSALRLYQEGSQNKLASSRVVEGLGRYQQVWIKYFRETLETLSAEHFIPKDILAIGDPLTTPILLDALKQEKYDEILLGGHSFSTTLLNASILAGQCGYQIGTATNQGEHLLVGSVFCDKLLNIKQDA